MKSDPILGYSPELSRNLAKYQVDGIEGNFPNRPPLTLLTTKEIIEAMIVHGA